MKLLVTVSGEEGLEAEVDSRFGRAPYFLFVDTESMEHTIQENKATGESSGAGVAAAQEVLDEKVQGVIAGNFGPKAFNSLKASQVKLYSVSGVTVEEAVCKLKRGGLEELSEHTRSAHSGLN